MPKTNSRTAAGPVNRDASVPRVCAGRETDAAIKSRGHVATGNGATRCIQPRGCVTLMGKAGTDEFTAFRVLNDLSLR